MLVVILIVAFAMLALSSARPRMRFSISDQFTVREAYPGGAFIDDDTVYRTCEHGYEARRFADGLYLRFPGRPCWR